MIVLRPRHWQYVLHQGACTAHVHVPRVQVRVPMQSITLHFGRRKSNFTACLQYACLAHAVPTHNVGVVVTKSDSDNKQNNLSGAILEDVCCRFPCHSDTLSSRKESNQLYSYSAYPMVYLHLLHTHLRVCSCNLLPPSLLAG